MKRILRLLYASIFLLFCAAAKGQDMGQLSKQKPFTITGVFGAGIGTYSSSGIDPRERKVSYLFNGTPTVNLYGIAFPFSIVVSDQQRGFRQPFNQYGISPTYKWATVHAGWQSIQWSQFTMTGYNILGGGVELNPGKLRLGFLYGRFNKAIEENSTQPLSFQTPAYKRMGYSAKIGYGTERNHLDFIVVNAKDDSTSLKNKPVNSNLSPAENLVLGINSKWSFLKHFVWDIDAAGSIYTRNSMDDTITNLKLGNIGFIKKMVTINSSSQLLTAGQTSIAYQNNNYNLGLQYRRVDPDYKSMGAYYFETDVENYTAQGGINLLKNQMQVTGSLGFQHDNLLHDKAYQSKRTISSLGVSYNNARYGADLRYSNYGVTQDRGLNPVIDTFRVARTNYNLNGLLRYTAGDSLITHNIILIGNIQSLVDLNRFTANQTQSNSKTANLSYQLGFNRAMFSINANLNYTVADLVSMKTIIYGPSIGVNKQFAKGRADIAASFTYQQQRNNSINAGNVMSGSLNGSYRFTSRDDANISVSYLKSNSKDTTLPSFNEMRSSLNLTHTF